MDTGAAAVAASSAVIVSTAARKHTKKQETGDTAKSCTTYQNLVFDGETAHTEPIIICDVEEQPTCPKNELSLGMELFFCAVIILAFALGFAVSKAIRSDDVY